MSDAGIKSEAGDRAFRPTTEPTVLGRITGTAWCGVRSFLLTIVGVGILGIILAGFSAYFLRNGPYVAAVAAVVALVESGGAAFLLASKRGVFAAVLSGLKHSNIIRSILGLVFERLLAVRDVETPGERGSRLAQAVEKVPLAQAERWLNRVIAGLLSVSPSSPTNESGTASQPAARGLLAWMRGGIYRGLLQRIRTLTLAAFRAEGTQSGGVDLLRVRDTLESRIDAMVVDRLQGAVNLWTFGVLLGLPLAVADQTYLALAWLGK